MENTLALFAILNCGDWCAAVIIHNFYYEALEKTKGKGDYTSTFNIEDTDEQEQCLKLL